MIGSRGAGMLQREDPGQHLRPVPRSDTTPRLSGKQSGDGSAPLGMPVPRNTVIRDSWQRVLRCCLTYDAASLLPFMALQLLGRQAVCETRHLVLVRLLIHAHFALNSFHLLFDRHLYPHLPHPLIPVPHTCTPLIDALLLCSVFF